jgi:hypothetical protein
VAGSGLGAETASSAFSSFFPAASPDGVFLAETSGQGSAAALSGDPGGKEGRVRALEG